MQHGSPPPGGLHGLQEEVTGSRGRGRGARAEEQMLMDEERRRISPVAFFSEAMLFFNSITKPAVNSCCVVTPARMSSLPAKDFRNAGSSRWPTPQLRCESPHLPVRARSRAP